MNLESLHIEVLPIELVKPYYGNARTHSDEQVAQIAASIEEFGFTNPILIDRANVVIAGHGRLAAAVSLGLYEVPCLRLDNLSDAQRRAYILADNKLAENAGWDRSLLRLELFDLKNEGFDLGLTGFSDDELDALLDVDTGSDGDDEGEEETFALTITSKDEAEIIALRKLFGIRKNAAKVEAGKVFAVLPVD